MKVGQRRSWPRGVATEKAAVGAVPAEEEEGGPLGDWAEKELAGDARRLVSLMREPRQS